VVEGIEIDVAQKRAEDGSLRSSCLRCPPCRIFQDVGLEEAVDEP
jgi:hypothetical protein